MIIYAYPNIPRKLRCPKCGSKHIEINALTENYVCGGCGHTWVKTRKRGWIPELIIEELRKRLNK